PPSPPRRPPGPPRGGPSGPMAPAKGDLFPGGGPGSFAAVTGSPHLTVPRGWVRGLRVGLSFMGPKWSEELLLNLGFAYEQARGPFATPRFFRSIEESPEIAPYLEPAPR